MPAPGEMDVGSTEGEPDGVKPSGGENPSGDREIDVVDIVVDEGPIGQSNEPELANDETNCH